MSEGLIAVLSGSIAKGDVKQVMELLDVAFAYCTSAANTAQAHAKGAAAAGGGAGSKSKVDLDPFVFALVAGCSPPPPKANASNAPTLLRRVGF
ncbi:MAG: hypothetical protein Q8P67_06275 [archaeon]|nr:hypothetical protein [archaeon]